MSYLEKLLEGVEVEWKSLGDVYKFQYGKGNTIPQKGGKYPVYGSNGIVGTHDEYNSEDSPVIGHIGAYAGIVNWGKGKHFVTYNGVICRLINDLVHPKYAYYFLLKQDFNSMAKSASHPFISYEALNKVTIPIPPLSVQKEIVRILDTFTELTAELTTELKAELTARKQQYSYYREQLLSFDEGEVEWKSLGEIFEFKNGINKAKEFFGKGDVIINYTDVFKNSKLLEKSINGKVELNNTDFERFNCQKGDVFFTRTSETKDEIGFAAVLLSDIPVCVFSGFLIRARPITDLLLPEYCAYCFKSLEIRKKIISSSNMTTRVTTTGTILSKIKIPIPPLKEQERIVSILDKFDTLTNSISEGLPKEIELRKKQYEYYRDSLLTFPQLESV